ncbi:MAG: hypothetical protein M1814_002004 [Vezdaea aestivalis]|nr:MAG: hypothetical protein M1814_002004 [Vezdaea aestivalis]
MNPNFSPADSLLSDPSTTMSPLFDSSSQQISLMAMTPKSFDGDSRDVSEAPEQKPTKKRKSWGQELPTPKTNLPPRKRAKTEDEKEQRRIERVLRNRAAAHSSRERKRKEVEGLESEKHGVERENLVLRARNQLLTDQVRQLADQVKRISAATGIKLPEPVKSLPPSPIKADFSYILPPPLTVDPRDSSFSSPTDSPSITAMAGPDLTQHPAEMLCDPQCQSEAMPSAAMPSWTYTLAPSVTPLHFLIMASATYSYLALPLAQIFHSLKTGTSLPSQFLSYPTTNFFQLILWLISATPPHHSMTPPQTPLSTSSPTPSTATTQPAFRLSLLERLLACSPALARPLRAATARELQQMSNSAATGVKSTGMTVTASMSSENRTLNREESGRASSQTTSPSMAMLVTVMWALDNIERKQTAASNSACLDPATEVHRLCQSLDSGFEQRGRSERKVAGRSGQKVVSYLRRK